MSSNREFIQTQTEAKIIRDRIKGYAARIPHHEAFGEFEILNFDKFYMYSYRMKTLLEGRSIGSVDKVLDENLRKYIKDPSLTARLRGASGSQPASFKSEIVLEARDVWAYDCGSPDLFQKSRVERFVEASSKIRNCTRCKGDGAIVCDKCQGNKSLQCAACMGAGKNACKKCNPSGRLTCNRCGGLGESKCPTCRGAKLVMRQEVVGQLNRHCTSCKGGRIYGGRICYWCNGTGILFIDQVRDYAVPCQDCRATGNQTCKSCQGRKSSQCPDCRGTLEISCSQCIGGSIRCSRCQASGITTCPECRGGKKFMSYSVLTQTIEPTSVTGLVASSQIPEKAIPRSPDFQPWLDEHVAPGPIDVDTMPLPIEGELRERIKKLVSDAQPTASRADGRRIVRQTLSIARVEFVRVRYSHGGREYVLWLVGRELRVFAPQSPITEFAETLVNEALKYWSVGDRKSASALARQVWEMGKKDLVCDLGHRFPLALKAYTWSHGLLTIPRRKKKTARLASTNPGSKTLYSKTEPQDHSQSLPLAIPARSNTTEAFTSQTLVGSLTVVTSPAGWFNKPVCAEVYIDGELRGTVTPQHPFSIELSPKTYLLKVILESSVTFRKGVKSVMIVADKITVFTIASNGKLTHSDGPKAFGN